MKQLKLFDEPISSHVPHEKAKHVSWKVFVDGASRNNPGPSGAGIVIMKNDEPVVQEGFYLGKRTNNQAEYLALLLGIFFLEQQAKPGDNVRIISDSELLVKQINGIYRVKNELLKPLHAFAKKTIERLGCVVTHVLRHENVQADALANQGIDQKKSMPPDFLLMINRHDIVL